MIEKYSRIIINTALKKNIPQIDWNEICLKKLLTQASHNRALYVFAKNLLSSGLKFNSKTDQDLLKDIKKQGEKNLSVLKNTLLLLKTIFSKEKIDYLIVKTFKSLDYITFDVDFLVRHQDFERTIKKLKENGLAVKPHPNARTQGQHQRNCFKPGFLKMDMHRKFFWLGINHIDLGLVWSKINERNICGVKCPVPCSEAEFVINAGQLVHERGYITLLDFLALKQAGQEILNWHKIIEQTKKHKWENSFLVLLDKLNFIHKEIFGEYIVNFEKYYPGRKPSRKKPGPELKLPLMYPVKDVISVFKEIVKNQKHFLYLEFFYYFFSKTRYLVKNRLPFYDHWYNFNGQRKI